MNEKVLIGLAGRGTINGQFASTARVGKDEVARVLRDDCGFRTYSFALPLKQATQVLFGLTEDQMWQDKIKNVELPVWGMSPRKLYQLLGTEGGREIFDPDMWARMAMFVWEDVKAGRPYTLTNTADIAITGEQPRSREDFDFILHQAAQTMFQLENEDIKESLLNGTKLKRWDYTFQELKDGIKEKTIPAILGMPPKEAWVHYVATRKQLPMVLKASNGPYGTPPIEAAGMSVPDNRFDNEANIMRANGGHMVHVRRELPAGIELVHGHASEQGVTPHEKDHYIDNDGTLEQLRQRTLALVESIQCNAAPTEPTL